jgi:hypothetical protein
MELLLDSFQDDVHDQAQPAGWSNGDVDAAMPSGSGVAECSLRFRQVCNARLVSVMAKP